MGIINFNIINDGKCITGKGELINADFEFGSCAGAEQELTLIAKIIPKDDIYLTVIDYDKIIAENKQLREVNKQLQLILNEN